VRDRSHDHDRDAAHDDADHHDPDDDGGSADHVADDHHDDVDDSRIAERRLRRLITVSSVASPGGRLAGGATGAGHPCAGSSVGAISREPVAIAPPTLDRRPRSGLALSLLGLALVVVGVVGYFVAVIKVGAWLPRVRNEAIPNLILIAAGLVVSTLALTRVRRRALSGAVLGVGVLLAAAFAGMLFVALALPPVTGPAIGAAAPDFSAPDQTGKTIRLADFRGHPLLLVFYRGHW
jgi:hypothetical protein